jgi:hypothetical protein
MVTLTAAPQAIVTATRRTKTYRIAEPNAAPLRWVPERTRANTELRPQAAVRHAPSQKRGFGCTPSNLWLRSASQFIEARSLCQSRHAMKAAIITIPVPKAANNETTVAMIATKVSVIKVHPDHVCVQTPP